MTLWQRIREVPGRVWFWCVAIALTLVTLVLRRSPRAKSAAAGDRKIDHGLGVADRVAEERANIRKGVTAVDAKIAAVDSGDMDGAELAKRWNKRKRK